jgi:hypothetical protein
MIYNFCSRTFNQLDSSIWSRVNEMLRLNSDIAREKVLASPSDVKIRGLIEYLRRCRLEDIELENDDC